MLTIKWKNTLHIYAFFETLGIHRVKFEMDPHARGARREGRKRQTILY